MVECVWMNNAGRQSQAGEQGAGEGDRELNPVLRRAGFLGKAQGLSECFTRGQLGGATKEQVPLNH